MCCISIQEGRAICSTLKFVIGSKNFICIQLNSFSCTGECQTRGWRKEVTFQTTSDFSNWHDADSGQVPCENRLPCVPSGNNLSKSLLTLFHHWKGFFYTSHYICTTWTFLFLQCAHQKLLCNGGHMTSRREQKDICNLLSFPDILQNILKRFHHWTDQSSLKTRTVATVIMWLITLPSESILMTWAFVFKIKYVEGKKQ